jgi:multimeric flavodoxin WrbA
MKKADGILLGSPVHYADISGAMKSFLDRAFYVTSVNNRMLRHKVGGSVIAVRRSGGVSAFSTLNNYLLYQEMFLAGSNYWNVIHGTAPGEVAQDGEGQQIMRILGRNMAWLMKTVRLGRETLPVPEMEQKIFTHFVR